MAIFLDCATAVSQTDGRQISLNFKRRPGRWIYCNYPERLPPEALGDSPPGNKYLNRVIVCGEAQLFASYVNATGGDIFFGVLLGNPGSEPACAIRKNSGHRHSGAYPDWCDVEGGVWSDFYADISEEVFIVHPGEGVWIFEQAAPFNKFFNSVVCFATDRPLECLVYIYRNREGIGGAAACFPWLPGDKQYRGEGDAFAIETDVALYASRMPYKYYTCRCGAGNANEMTAIYDPCAGEWRCCACPDRNLGNWGMQYLFDVLVINDTKTAKIVRSYVGSDGKTPGANAVIRFGNRVRWCCTGRQEWWNWLVDYLPPGRSRTYEYLFIHAANSTSPVLHAWRLE